jgi:hypothetical protein
VGCGTRGASVAFNCSVIQGSRSILPMILPRPHLSYASESDMLSYHLNGIDLLHGRKFLIAELTSPSCEADLLEMGDLHAVVPGDRLYCEIVDPARQELVLQGPVWREIVG